MLYNKHVFICTNERPAGSRISCGESHGLELVAAFKKLIKDRGLNTDIRAQKAGCMEACEAGPSVAIYPEGVFYSRVQLADVEEIVTEHLQNNRKVERLLMNYEELPWFRNKKQSGG
ncbi:ferredoxin [Paradesertivirga mongoliensis]|uniref:Ferredoxin n=1 Tax=Paradesertivirga mongoliensis TaxID=2100740 RepID=A0ABW4ZJI2_9SPHI|nr:(2Fe-2S) ferredoxin domain-containing protein [Pedobacter mongoliensis]